MADHATLKLIQADIKSIKSQIDILRMETRAHQLAPVAYLLELAFQEVAASEVPGANESEAAPFQPVVFQ